MPDRRFRYFASKKYFMTFIENRIIFVRCKRVLRAIGISHPDCSPIAWNFAINFGVKNVISVGDFDDIADVPAGTTFFVTDAGYMAKAESFDPKYCFKSSIDIWFYLNNRER
jgi:hypothetical protein